jgi:hypothetical protein
VQAINALSTSLISGIELRDDLAPDRPASPANLLEQE